MPRRTIFRAAALRRLAEDRSPEAPPREISARSLRPLWALLVLLVGGCCVAGALILRAVGPLSGGAP